MSWDIAKFAPQNIQLWNSREMGQVFGLLGVKGSLVGDLGSEVIGLGKGCGSEKQGSSQELCSEKRNDGNISKKWFVIPLKWNYDLFLVITKSTCCAF